MHHLCVPVRGIAGGVGDGVAAGRYGHKVRMLYLRADHGRLRTALRRALGRMGAEGKQSGTEAQDAKRTRSVPQEADKTEYREFVLPRERLTGAARGRFVKIIKGTVFAALGVFALITVTMLWGGALGSPLRLLYILLFAFAICVPGILAQWAIYKKYAAAVPGRIALYPGRLEVDDSVFTAGEIQDIRISPDRLYNTDSPAVFRGMAVRTARGVKRYRMDFRSGRASKEGIYWEGYSEFSTALQAWGKAGGVTVTVAYME